MNTENDVVRTESMTLRVWRARIESVVFGKDDARQVTAMFSTEQEAKALAADLMQFARGQSVLVAPFSGEDQARIAALNAGERAMQPATEAPSAAQVEHHLRTAAALASSVPGDGARAGPGAATPSSRRFCSACGTEAAPGARFCSQCAAQLTV